MKLIRGTTHTHDTYDYEERIIRTRYIIKQDKEVLH